MFDIIGKRNYFFAFSLIILIPGLIAIIATPFSGGQAGLRFSVDYTGGTVWQFQLKDSAVTADQVKAVVVGVDPSLSKADVTKDSGGMLTLRTSRTDLQPAPTKPPTPTAAPTSSASGSASASASGSASASTSASPSASESPSASPSASPSSSASASASSSASASASESASPSPSASASASASASPTPTPTPTPSPTPTGVNPVTGQGCGPVDLPQSGVFKKLSDAIQAKYGPIACTGTRNTVGAIISSDLITQTILLIIMGSFGILAWIWFRFNDYKMGTTALIALVHDVIVVVGIFAILGTFFGVEIDALFVTAMLTVIGFSVHDTIVVFDRIRENRARHAGEPFEMIVNHSILQTLGRSIATSFTVVMTLLALYLFGGSAIHYFVLALLIGIISGTYSSIFNASPLLVVWQLWEDRRKAKAASAVRTRRANA